MNRSKQIGTAAETAVVKAAQARGIPARRVALAGNLDQGDVHLWGGDLVIEVKAGAQTKAPSLGQLEAWHDEAELEAGRVSRSSLPVLVCKRWGTGDAGRWPARVNLLDLLTMYPRGAILVTSYPFDVDVTLELGDLLNLIESTRPKGTQE